MTTTYRTLTAALLAALLAACGQKDKADPYLAAVPDAAALTIDTAPAATAAGAGVAIVDPIHVTTFGDDLGVVHAKAKALNDGVRAVFARLEEVAATGGDERPGNVKVYGPSQRCVEPDGAGGCTSTATLRLVVKLFSGTKSGYLLQAKNQGGTWDPVLAGYLLHGATGRRGAGRLWVNLDNLAADAGPGYRGQGLLAAGFAAGPVAKRAGYLMVRFTPDTAQHAPVSAAFRGWRNALGVARARVAGIGNLDTTTAADELGFWRGVWSPDLGGRSFTLITNYAPGGVITGDVLPVGTLHGYWFARACYAPGQTEAKFKEWWLCDRTVTGEATPAACVANAAATSHEIVIDTASAGSWAAACGADAGAFVLPAGAPGASAEDLSDEDDESQAYVEPEPCPTDARTPADTSPPGMQGGMGMGM